MKTYPRAIRILTISLALLFSAGQVPAKQALYYLTSAQLSAEKLSPPPAQGDENYKSDYAALHKWQEKRTAEDCSRAESESDAEFEQFFPDGGPFKKPLPAEAKKFFEQVGSDVARAVAKAKKIYSRPRPFREDKTLRPCLKNADSFGFAYPSGHATAARVFARILSSLAPKRTARFLARADEAGLDRVIGGVHHPSDIEAGKRFGDELYKKFSENAAFRADLEKLRACLK